MHIDKKIWKKLLISIKDFDLENIHNLSSTELILINENLFIHTDKKNLSILKTHQPQIQKLFEKELKKKLNIFFKENTSNIDKNKSFHEIQINKKNNLKNFVIHSSNEWIFEILKKHICSANEINSIFLWGNKGIGKTHLISSLMEIYKNTFPKKKYFYSSLFDFSNKYHEFLKLFKNEEKCIDFFLEYDLIIFDDFHFLKNRENTSKIIIFIIKEVVKKNKKIIFISTEKNNVFKEINNNLILEIEKGFIFKLNEPNVSDVKSIITRFIKNENPNLKISDEALNYLSSIMGNNISVILNYLIKIIVFYENSSSLKIIDINNLKKVLEEISFFKKTKEFVNHSNNQQLKIICSKLNFDLQEILGVSRKKRNVFQRNIVIYIFKTKLNFSHEYIGKIFNKNHSTITHSIKQINLKLKKTDFKEYLNLLIEKVF